jgi:hypothetical protein
MAYNFTTAGMHRLRRYLNSVFNTASGHDHDGVNSKKPITSLTMVVSVEDLGAGADIADRLAAIVPTGESWVVTATKIISNGTPADIDDSNTCVVVLKNGTNAIFTQTYNTGTAFPAAGAATVPDLDADYTTVAAGSALKFSVTNGTSADPPAFLIQVTVKVTVS